MRIKPHNRIMTGRLYVRMNVPGISGFQKWNERVYSVVSAEKARVNRLHIIGEAIPDCIDTFQTRGETVSGYDITKHLKQFPYDDMQVTGKAAMQIHEWAIKENKTKKTSTLA